MPEMSYRSEVVRTVQAGQLSCTTCGRSTHRPDTKWEGDTLAEACCDRSHSPYLHELGRAYSKRFRAFHAAGKEW